MRKGIEDMKQIRAVIAEHYGLTVEEICAASRERKIVQPRQVSMHFCRLLTNASMLEIARFHNLKNSTTAHYATKVVTERLSQEEHEEILQNIRDTRRVFIQQELGF